MTAHSRQTQSEEQALTGFADTVFSLKQTNKTKKCNISENNTDDTHLQQLMSK